MIDLHKKTNLTDSSAPGKSGTVAGWEALRALSDAPRQAHAYPTLRTGLTFYSQFGIYQKLASFTSDQAQSIKTF